MMVIAREAKKSANVTNDGRGGKEDRAERVGVKQKHDDESGAAGGGGRAYSVAVFLSHLAIDHAFFSKRRVKTLRGWEGGG